MPATRAQRQRVQQRRHANLPDELIRKIIDIAGPYCVLVKGGQACTLDIPRTAGRTAKAYLAPVSNNLKRVGVNYSLEDAIAAVSAPGTQDLEAREALERERQVASVAVAMAESR